MAPLTGWCLCSVYAAFSSDGECTFIILESLPLCLFRSLRVSFLSVWLILLSSPWRKRQLQFLLEGRGRRAGLSPEELRDNGKLLGEGLSRALFNYPSRDCSTDSPEVSLVLFTVVFSQEWSTPYHINSFVYCWIHIWWLQRPLKYNELIAIFMEQFDTCVRTYVCVALRHNAIICLKQPLEDDKLKRMRLTPILR